MSVGAIAGVGPVASVPVLPARLLRVDTARQVEALTRLAITPSVTPEQLAVALGVTVKEVAGLVEAYQAALRTLLSTSGFWLPAVDTEVAEVLPLVQPRTPAAGVPRLAAVLEAGMDAASRGTGASAPVDSVHGAYLRAVGLRPAAQTVPGGSLEATATGMPAARLAIQVGAGPAGIVFLLDDAVAPSPGSVHAAAHVAVAAAGHGKAPTTVVAQLTSPHAIPNAGPVSVTGPVPIAGSVPIVGSAGSPVVQPQGGTSAGGSVSPALGGVAQTSGGAPVNPGTTSPSQIAAPPVHEALLAARENPRAGYRAWPGPPLPAEPVPAKDVDAVARLAAPSRAPLLLAAPLLETAAAPEGVAAAAGGVARAATVPADAVAVGAREVLVAAGGGPTAAQAPGAAVVEGPDGAVVVADGRAVPAAIEAARQEPARVAALVLDLTSLLRAALELAPSREGVAAAALASASGLVPADPGRLAELLAATTLGRSQEPAPKRRRRRRSTDPDQSNLAKDFFAALFSIRVADDLLAAAVPVTVLGPDLPELAGLARALDQDQVNLSVRLTDLPMVEVLEVLRLG